MDVASLVWNKLRHNNNRLVVPVFTIEHGRWTQKAPTYALQIEAADLHAQGPEITLASMVGRFTARLGEVVDFLYALQDLAYPWGDHRAVLQDQGWRVLYQYGKRSVPFVRGTTVVWESRQTFPCMQCGIVLPEELIHVDHQRPKTEEGGDESVAKVLRAFDYADDVSVGWKIGQFRQHGWEHAKFKPIPTKKEHRDTHPHNVLVRYTLNVKGMLIASVIRQADYYREFEKLCMNSKLNLAPLCAHCNSVIKKATLKC